MEQEPVAVFLRQEVMLLPFHDKHSHLVLPFGVHTHLFFRHRHEEVLVNPAWHLQLHVLLAPSDKNVAQLFSYIVQSLVA